MRVSILRTIVGFSGFAGGVFAALIASCSGSNTREHPGGIAAVGQPSNAPAHAQAASYAYGLGCLGALSAQDRLEIERRFGLPIEKLVQLWINDPDCGGHDCLTNPQPELMHLLNRYQRDSAQERSSQITRDYRNALIRNENHFTNNPVGGINNRQAEDAARLLAREAVTRGDYGSALREISHASHFVQDRNQCGHTTGNAICDPRLPNPSVDCIRWLNDNKDNHPPSLRYVLRDPPAQVLLVGCIAMGRSLAECYASVERYVRHHHHLPPGERFIGDPPGIPNSRCTETDQRDPECRDGECAPPGSSSDGQVVLATFGPLCDQIRAHRECPSPRRCTWQGGGFECCAVGQSCGARGCYTPGGDPGGDGGTDPLPPCDCGSWECGDIPSQPGVCQGHSCGQCIGYTCTDDHICGVPSGCVCFPACSTYGSDCQCTCRDSETGECHIGGTLSGDSCGGGT